MGFFTFILFCSFIFVMKCNNNKRNRFSLWIYLLSCVSFIPLCVCLFNLHWIYSFRYIVLLDFFLFFFYRFKYIYFLWYARKMVLAFTLWLRLLMFDWLFCCVFCFRPRQSENRSRRLVAAVVVGWRRQYVLSFTFIRCIRTRDDHYENYYWNFCSYCDYYRWWRCRLLSVQPELAVLVALSRTDLLLIGPMNSIDLTQHRMIGACFCSDCRTRFHST